MKKMKSKAKRRASLRSGNPGKGRRIKTYACKRCDRLINEAHRKQHDAWCQKVHKRRHGQHADVRPHFLDPDIRDRMRVLAERDLPLQDPAHGANLIIQDLDIGDVDSLFSQDATGETMAITFGDGIVVIKRKG